MDECVIETSGHVDVEWLCKLWERYPEDRSACLYGFHQMSTFHDSATRDEIMFLQGLALQLEIDEACHVCH